MTSKQNENHDYNVNEQFSDDMKALFEPKTPIHPRIDRAVMDRAAAQLHHRTNRPLRVRWVGYASSIGAAIFLGILLLNTNKPTQTPTPITLQNDIDRDGTVNILDAFQLAKQITSHSTLDPKWDTNGDGVVDQKDVDTVAMAAVCLNEGVL